MAFEIPPPVAREADLRAYTVRLHAALLDVIRALDETELERAFTEETDPAVAVFNAVLVNRAVKPPGFTAHTHSLILQDGILAIEDTNGINALFATFTTSHAPVVSLVRGRGTIASRTAVQSGDGIGSVVFNAQHGTGVSNWSAGTGVISQATENWGASNRGASASLYATANGATSAAECLTVQRTGTAADVAAQVYDEDNAQMEQISVGTADSGGTGFKVLRIPN